MTCVFVDGYSANSLESGPCSFFYPFKVIQMYWRWLSDYAMGIIISTEEVTLGWDPNIGWMVPYPSRLLQLSFTARMLTALLLFFYCHQFKTYFIVHAMTVNSPSSLSPKRQDKAPPRP